MRKILKRCKHCKSIYSFQASGQAALKENDDTYCSDCMNAIQESLKDIPIKREPRFREFPASKELIEKILLVDENYRKYRKSKEPLWLNVHRVILTSDNWLVVTFGFYNPNYASIFEMITKDSIKTPEEIFERDIHYNCTLVNSKEELIQIEWEWDSENNQWKDYPWKDL